MSAHTSHYQISGSFAVAKDALVEIASRLRTRCLHDANTRGELSSVRPLPGFSPGGHLRNVGFSHSSPILAGGLGRYEHSQVSICSSICLDHGSSLTRSLVCMFWLQHVVLIVGEFHLLSCRTKIEDCIPFP